MNHTGVVSTGSRLQALRNLESATSGFGGYAEEFAGQRPQLLDPDWLEAQLSAQRRDFVAHVVFETIVPGDDRDGRAGQAGNRADGAKQLQSARQRHPQIE